MPEVELLDKTEVWVRGVTLDGADLRFLAASAARALDLEPDLVFVTDARDDHVVFDVLKPRMKLASIVGREPELLAAVGEVAGVTVSPGASVHSRGVMGMIGTPSDEVAQTLTRATEIDDRLRCYVSSRVAVVSTGPEVVAGSIKDTNVSVALDILGRAGFEVTAAGAVVDDEDAIVGRVLRLVSEGFGVVITTGGVGAEDKDRTIEALQRCDPHLVTEVLSTYPVGHGRHVKPHVRIGIGEVAWTRLIALPGPTREVEAALPIVVQGLERGWDDIRLAHALGKVLRACLR
ncbi:molybdopterin-binding protein [Mycobacterium sp.]|uniref:molybdopterin-binding protein n=1 Tax=Mycobacterium sp. TaxID=1785 RepID=UPI003F9E75B3